MNQRRLDHIDGLRGFPAVAVVVFHLRVVASGAPSPTPDRVVDGTNRVFDVILPRSTVLVPDRY